ncbi:hypothetical protein ACRE_024370 [Hapsidospora chrysogenum ATCC 11550]|uniref:Uncharacterized protein n=1 Tax=Hapsidospora chrysogenum (strain ATCC 11550 / CBS 779.69 / DSM 880 / IAM 14645 / JCM 23072 / IMI 49137) TaxID=857340 RepID=A0A086TBM5_HAPC1|nr:hypothetical protein ACRE_024370 [Hapsidospora chrysogenum ATCC 11550]
MGTGRVGQSRARRTAAALDLISFPVVHRAMLLGAAVVGRNLQAKPSLAFAPRDQPSLLSHPTHTATGQPQIPSEGGQNIESIESSRDNQSQNLLGGAGNEVGLGPNGAPLVRQPAENISVSRRRRSVAAQRPHNEPLGQGVDRLPGGENEPPVNAPTAPASLRRLAHAAKAQKTSLPQKPSETGLWSQSKRWVSQETKERAAFQKLMQTLHYMRADKSPFVPQTPAALTAFRVAQTERKSRRLSEELNRRMLQLARRKRSEAHEEPGAQPKLELFRGKTPRDGLSPVFASDTCFNKDIPCAMRVEWPSLAELKEEGEKRAARYGRYFPLPRLNIVASRILQRERAKAYNADGSIHWEKKAVKQASRFIRPVSCELELDSSPPPQLQAHELPPLLQALLDEIDETSSEDHGGSQDLKEEET